MRASELMQRLGRYWRVFATGLSFAAFGVGGLLLWALVFPVLHLMVRQPERRVACARAIIRLTFLAFVGLMRSLGVLRYEIIGREKLERGGMLILANHPTLIDTVFLMAFVKRADCIVKSRLWNNPFTRGPVRAAGYINNEQGAELVDACIATLRAGNNLIVFPEGTRTPADGVISLKRGAANIAVRGSCAITPVLIRCEPPTLGKGEKWWRVPARFVQFRLEVKEDIQIQRFTAAGYSGVMAARHLTDHLQHYFTEENRRHA
ncbi:MAG: 1-acyl-sn-glycerol-3-phosphate acyltransferase [Burkholderiales bacterium]|nr:1-acyl-sn-glycerol-3-phosphate acyltransferase [Burkholderiales bacterium]